MTIFNCFQAPNVKPVNTTNAQKMGAPGPSLAKALRGIFKGSKALPPADLRATTSQFAGKNLPVFKTIKQLFAKTPAQRPIRPFQECLNELQKTPLSTAWDRANKDKAEVKEDGANIRAKITATLPVLSTRPTSPPSTGKTSKETETSTREPQTETPIIADEINPLPDVSHLLELNLGWKNLETLIANQLLELRRSRRHNPPLEERLLPKLQPAIKLGSIEAELLNHFEADVLATIKTMIEESATSNVSGAQPTKTLKTGGKIKFIPKGNHIVQHAVERIVAEEIKQASSAPVKTALLTRVAASIEDSHDLPKEQTTQILEALMEEARNNPKNQTIETTDLVEKQLAKQPSPSIPTATTSMPLKSARKPPLHPNLSQQKPSKGKTPEPIVTPSPELQAKAAEEEKAVKGMVQAATHQTLRAVFAASLDWSKLNPEATILRKVSEQMTKEGKTPPTALITQHIKDTLGDIETQPYQFTAKPTSVAQELNFTGAYFKKTSPTGKQLLPNTLVKSGQGNIYELLNKLTAQDVSDIETQHGMKEQATPEGEKGNIVGQGGFGKIRFARNIDTQDIVVVKKVSTLYKNENTAPEEAPANAAQDIEIPSAIRDRIKIGRRAGYPLKGFENSFAFFKDVAMVDHRPMREKSGFRENIPNTSSDKVYIFSDLANMGDGERLISDIYALRQTNRTDAKQLLLKTATDYSRTVMHLHALGFHHRDIKPENFLHSIHNGTKYAKLADFGVTEDAAENKTCIGGTHLFAPPEWVKARAIIENDPNDTNYVYFADKHDAFSLGVTLQRISCNLPCAPFYQKFEEVYKTQGDLTPILASQNLPIQLREKTGAIKRITVSLISEDQLSYKGIEDADLQGIDINNLDMNHFDNIIAKLLINDPTKRMSVDEAYEHFENLTNIR